MCVCGVWPCVSSFLSLLQCRWLALGGIIPRKHAQPYLLHPPARWLSATGGRDLDASTRGLGGTLSCPMTSCGEENLTMVEDRCRHAGKRVGQGRGQKRLI